MKDEDFEISLALPEEIRPLIEAAGAEAVLGGWYATPLDKTQAKLLGSWATARQTRSHAIHSKPLTGLLQLVARFWLGLPCRSHFQHLAIRPNGLHHRILTELVYGQLLMSRRLGGAMEHLSRGTELGHRLMTASDYLLLLRRHQRLAVLPLGDKPQPAEGLDSLLRIASVITQLQPKTRTTYPHDPGDLYG